GTRHEQNHMLWLAVCKRYRFIHDFAVEVVREKFLRLDLELSYHDYDVFFNDKAEWHPEVEGVADSTRKKQRQVVFRMLREADLLSEDGQILPAILTPREIEIVAADDPKHMAIFPVSPIEIQEFLA
ncbi:MAG: BrxA family protein, partial [Anaerolineae bacterium]